MADDDIRAGLPAFLLYSILAGGNAVGIRFSNMELDPYWGATLRFLLAALVMVTLMVAGRHRMPTGRALLGAVLYGLFAFGGAFAFAFYALVELEAGFGQIVLAIVPLLTLILGAAQGLEKLTPTAVGGALIAVVGVALMSQLSISGDLPVLSLAALLGSAACFAQASLTVKRFPALHPVVLNAVGMTAGVALLGVVTAIAGDRVTLPTRLETWMAVLYMVILGSAAVFSLYVVVLRSWHASRANYGFVLIPVFTVLFSSWLLDEALTFGLLGGGALVLASVYFGALRHGHSSHHVASSRGGAHPAAGER